MDSNSPINSLFSFRRSKVLRFLISLLIITLGVSLCSLWQNLTPYIQSKGIGVLLALLWWVFCFSKDALYVLEICPFSAIFAYIEKANIGDIQTTFDLSENSCVQVKLISHVYLFFYLYYAGGFFIYILLSFGLFIYTGYERIYIIPRNNANNFAALEKLEFASLKLDILQNQTLCSICINDFKERDLIIRLPVCCHCFHAECLRKWLCEQCICPYCRSNIMDNQKMLGK